MREAHRRTAPDRQLQRDPLLRRLAPARAEIAARHEGQRRTGDRRDRARARRRRHRARRRPWTRPWRCREMKGFRARRSWSRTATSSAEADVFERIRTNLKRLQPVRLRHRGLREPPPHRRHGACRAGRAVRGHRRRRGRRRLRRSFQEYVQSPVLTDIAVEMEGFERTTSSRCRSRTCSPTDRW